MEIHTSSYVFSFLISKYSLAIYHILFYYIVFKWLIIEAISMSESVHCLIRPRPHMGTTFGSPIWRVKGSSISRESFLSAERTKEPFYFDKVYDIFSRTEDVFKDVESAVDGSLKGLNTSVLAYGQSGSGKTYTLTGSSEEDGIVQLSLKRLFTEIENSDRTFILNLSVAEVYNERIYDLLGDGEDLPVRETAKGKIVIEGLMERPITNMESVETYINSSIARRNVGATVLNERSSRSHVLYMIQIESKSSSSSSTLTSSLCIVDLAGSENINVNQGTRASEGKFINKSLFFLCQAITQLSEKQSHIGYRESKLTRLLKPSLSGNSRVFIIATIDCYVDGETLSTLNFAKSALKVKVAPQVNENAEEEGVLISYLRQIEELKEQLKNREDEKDEKRTMLEELKKLILVGGEHRKDTFKSKKNRRMTWAPGRAVGNDSSILFIPPFNKPILENEEVINESNEPRRSLDLLSDDTSPSTQSENELIRNEELEGIMNEMNEKRKRIEEERIELEKEKNNINMKKEEMIKMNEDMMKKEKELIEKEMAWKTKQKEIIENENKENEKILNENEKIIEMMKKEMNEMESNLRIQIVNEVKGRCEMLMNDLIESNNQLKHENNLLSERIEALTKAEKSMYIYSNDVDECDRLEEINKELNEKLKKSYECIEERDEYIKKGKTKIEEMTRRLKEAEKKACDKEVLLDQRANQVNRLRDEYELKKEKIEEIIKRKDEDIDMMKKELEEEKKKNERLIERLDKEKIKIYEEKKCMKNNEETLRLNVVRLERELIIEKEKKSKVGINIEVQTEMNGDDINSLIEGKRKVEMDYEEYVKIMEKKEKEGRELAQSNVQYWKERARKAEGDLKIRGDKMKNDSEPLSRIDNTLSSRNN